MRNKFSEVIEIPEGIKCDVNGVKLECSKGDQRISRDVRFQDAIISVKGNTINIDSAKANKKTIATLKAFAAHIRNMFAGLETKFVYEMEICNVHFPMTVKHEGNKFIINNFLGEKEKRIAKILPSVDVEIKGVKIIISSSNIEAAGQTAANIEKATNVPKRDRRVFQDGIFITSKCGRPI
jgi:large subunit ribosomal protein L6